MPRSHKKSLIGDTNSKASFPSWLTSKDVPEARSAEAHFRARFRQTIPIPHFPYPPAPAEVCPLSRHARVAVDRQGVLVAWAGVAHRDPLELGLGAAVLLALKIGRSGSSVVAARDSPAESCLRIRAGTVPAAEARGRRGLQSRRDHPE